MLHRRAMAKRHAWLVDIVWVAPRYIMVVHTPPGHASMVAYDIDNAQNPYFLGTVAGDDTVLVVLQEDLEREIAREAIGEIVEQL